jgi:hypothetical protein
MTAPIFYHLKCSPVAAESFVFPSLFHYLFNANARKARMEGPQPPASTNKGTTAPTMLNFKHTNLTPASMRSGPPTKRARSSAPTITIPSNPNPPKTSLSVLSEAAANTTPVPNKPKETIVVPSEPRPSSPPPVPVPRREIPTHMVINWDTFSQIRNGITTHFFNLWIKMLSSYYKEGIRKGFHLDLTLDEVHRYSSLAREWVVRHLKEDCSVKDHTDAITCTHFTTHAGLTLHTPASRYHGPAQQQMTWYEPACNVNGALAPPDFRGQRHDHLAVHILPKQIREDRKEPAVPLRSTNLC